MTAQTAAFSGEVKASLSPFSSMIRITPSAALRSAKGSLLPVGFSSIVQNPASVSSLSASATAIDTGEVGMRSFGPCGFQCSSMASATLCSSPCAVA